jgi:hypothetical protein
MMAGYYQCIYLLLDSRRTEASPRLRNDNNKRTTTLPYSKNNPEWIRASMFQPR